MKCVICKEPIPKPNNFFPRFIVCGKKCEDKLIEMHKPVDFADEKQRKKLTKECVKYADRCLNNEINK